MIKTLKIVLPSVLALGTLFGGDESRIGTSGGNQVLVPVGARGIAMAGSERVFFKRTRICFLESSWTS